MGCVQWVFVYIYINLKFVSLFCPHLSDSHTIICNDFFFTYQTNYTFFFMKFLIIRSSCLCASTLYTGPPFLWRHMIKTAVRPFSTHTPGGSSDTEPKPNSQFPGFVLLFNPHISVCACGRIYTKSLLIQTFYYNIIKYTNITSPQWNIFYNKSWKNWLNLWNIHLQLPVLSSRQCNCL